MAASIETSTLDLDKIMRLLEEYTRKLRSICNKKVDQEKLSRTVSIVGLVVFLGLWVSFMFAVRSLLQTSSTFWTLYSYISAAIMVVITVLLAKDVFIPRSHLSQASFDDEQIVATVRRLIQLASQYKEHASSRIGEQFEFELRLAEAEASLEMYYRVFPRQRPEAPSVSPGEVERPQPRPTHTRLDGAAGQPSPR